MNRQVTLYVGLGALGITAFLAICKYLKSKDKPPKVWKKVGILSDLMCFPIKSCGVIRAPEMECTILGPQIGILRDRFFMAVSLKNEALTARKYPKFVLIEPTLVDNKILKLEAPNMEPLNIDLVALQEKNIFDSVLWGDAISSFDCGESTATWFSQYLTGEPTGIRLVCFPKSHENKERIKENGIALNADTGAYTDLSSYNIINSSSVDDLNTKLTEKVTPLRFRPNFVVDGPAAFEEDNWHWVKIGDVVFKAIKNCARCLLTTVSPETGEKHPTNEPVTTLKKYRIIKDGKQNIRPNKVHGILGVHLVLKGDGGFVKLGDPVMVG